MAPVSVEPIKFAGWPPFLLDLFPQGATLGYVVDHYRIPDKPSHYWKIISIARLNPPGNLQVLTEAEPSNEKASHQHRGFAKSEVIEKGPEFLEYMVQSGAPVTGTTGAGGAAPKFLLREDHQGRFHADGTLPDAQTKHCWLVKFPRGASRLDQDILKAEKAYHDIAAAVGLQTHGSLEWHPHCLFIPRFDRVISAEVVEYRGLESFYSMVGLPEFGSRLQHETYLDGIYRYSSAPTDDLIEYCLRDFLNQMMGNTDNHGRNHALLKGLGWVRLAPLFDFAPMKFDQEGIVRNTRWNSGIEEGEIALLTDLLVEKYEVPPEVWNNKVIQFTKATIKLEEMMKNHGVPSQFITGVRTGSKMLHDALEQYCRKLR